MKIINGTDPACSPGSLPASSPAAADLGRMEALERIATTILQRLQFLEERIETLERSPNPAASGAAAPAVEHIAPAEPRIHKPAVMLTINNEAVRKGLLDKMW